MIHSQLPRKLNAIGSQIDPDYARALQPRQLRDQLSDQPQTDDRNDVANGDFSRSANHGALMLAALAKMRGEVGDDDGLGRWIDVMLSHVRLDVPVSSLSGLAALARGLDPARITNVVAPGRYDRAALAEARQVVRNGHDIHTSLVLLSGLSDLCELRCTRSARAEIWELRGTIAREMGWQDGARRASAEAASLRGDRAPRDAP